MRRESRNWKLVKDKELFEFSENSEHLFIRSTLASVKCEDCSSNILAEENWQAFLKTSSIVKNALSKVTFRWTIFKKK